MTTTPTRGDTRPVPDPTVLTTQQLYREIAALRELFETRFTEYDKAITILQTTTGRSPTPGEIDLDLTNFKVLVNQKFEGVKDTIDQRDIRLGQAEQAAKDAVTTAFTGSEKAVAAALQAAKEAVGAQSESFDRATTKAELATTKLLDALSVQIGASARGLDDKIDALKELINKLEQRVTTIESRGVGVRETLVDRRADRGFDLSLVVALISAAGFVALLIRDFGAR